MSLTGLNSSVLFAGQVGGKSLPCSCDRATNALVSSTQLGATKRSTILGTATFRICCLSPIDTELSMTNNMSMVLMVLMRRGATNTLLVLGVSSCTGRCKQLTLLAAMAQSKP